jgi:hydroxymethylpyrimidine pyrophosphatase-like HAD family hydrolase
MNCWIFDIDGVLTDPQQKKVVNETLWDQFTAWLQNGNPLTFNTGRSLEWVKQQILTPLESHLAKQNLPKSLFHNLMAVGEKGTDWLNFDPDGHPQQTIDDQISVPQDLIDQVKQITEQKFSDTMFFDSTKKTMISIEMKQNEDLNKFHEAQKQLVEELKNIIQNYNLSSQRTLGRTLGARLLDKGGSRRYKQTTSSLSIDATVIATDIQNTHTGKALGTKRILNWLNQRKFKITNFYTFGDSQSDLAMAQYLYSHLNNSLTTNQYQLTTNPNPVTFIYVGPNLHWNKTESPFPILHYPGFNQGTIQFLSTMN